MTPERGAASVWVLGFATMLMMATAAVLATGQAMVRNLALQSSVDRSALAGADVLVGVVPGIPCDHVSWLLENEGFSVVSCELNSASLRVVGQASFAGVRWSAKARAGVGEGGQ